MTLLKLARVSKTADDTFVLKDISFSQAKLQKIAIAGETGSGKTTLLKTIAGLVQPDEGEISFQNKKVTGPNDNLVPGHPRIAYLSQNFELPKFLRVEQVLAYAAIVSKKQMAPLFQVCQIDHLLKRKTDQLSGGEKQRIAVARLLISSPRLLLLDEPFSHLDMPHKSTLKTVVKDITDKLKITCILVSHDPGDTLSWADTILVLKDGQIVQHGTPEEIYNQPVNEYVAGLFGKFTVLRRSHFKILNGFGTAGRNGAKTFFRPHDFRIGRSHARSIKGKVYSVNFYGSHYEADVMVGKDLITIKTDAEPVKPGTSVFISRS